MGWGHSGRGVLTCGPSPSRRGARPERPSGSWPLRFWTGRGEDPPHPDHSDLTRRVGSRHAGDRVPCLFSAFPISTPPR